MTSEQATVAVMQALDAAGVSYVLVGSFSTNYYGIPRGTQDADFVIQPGRTGIASIPQRLGAGFRLDPQVAFETVTGTTRYLSRPCGRNPTRRDPRKSRTAPAGPTIVARGAAKRSPWLAGRFFLKRGRS